MPSHPIDFQLQADYYSTPELRAVFSEERRMERWLQVEAALAKAQGEQGIIPLRAAGEIQAKAKLEHLDREWIGQEYTRSRNSLMPVVKGLRRACENDCGQYVHLGATTQDILDTAQVLEQAEARQVLYRDLLSVEHLLVDHSRKFRNTPMIGRTHGQQALPTTFGLKSVIWAGEIRRHIERLKAVHPRAMAGQLCGAVGTMAALGPKAMEVSRRTMDLLGLQWRAPGWHTSRDIVAESASLMALMASTCEKVANEIYLLGKTEVGELAEQPPGSQMSSTMPHKRNPVFCQRITVLARHIRPLTGIVVESMAQEHERDPRLLWSEWLAMPQLSMYTGTALHYMKQVLEGLVVSESNMKGNLNRNRELVMSEWLLFRLAPAMGRTTAQEKLHAVIGKLQADSSSLSALLQEDGEIAAHLGAEDYEWLEHPERYIGMAGEMIDQALAEISVLQKTDPEGLES